MKLVQLSKRTGGTRRNKYEYTSPDFIELHLEDNQRVVSVDWRRGLESFRRSTVDWTYEVWIETQC